MSSDQIRLAHINIVASVAVNQLTKHFEEMLTYHRVDDFYEAAVRLIDESRTEARPEVVAAFEALGENTAVSVFLEALSEKFQFMRAEQTVHEQIKFAFLFGTGEINI